MAERRITGPVNNPGRETNKVLQVVNVMEGGVITGTTVMPLDNSIPAKTEGDELFTLAITPFATVNKLLIEVVIAGMTSSGGADTVVALFQDDTTGALAAASVTVTTASQMNPVSFTHYMTAGTVVETTFKVRVGPGLSGTATVNGSASGRLLGGVMASSITITEIAA